jgi:hypothetical protein
MQGVWFRDPAGPPGSSGVAVNLAEKSWLAASVGAGLLVVTIISWPSIQSFRKCVGWGYTDFTSDAWIIPEPRPVVNLYTWTPSVDCGEGYTQLKIHLEPSAGTDFDTIFAGCGIVLSADETHIEGPDTDLYVR